MPLSNLSELRKFLQSLGAEPKKSLSQNFLIDGNIVRKILQTAEIQAKDHVLEIGPGPGALSEAFLAHDVILYAVEKDRRFAQALQRFDGVTVFAEDIRDFDFTLLPTPCKVVSNLPYHLTAPILGLLMPQRSIFSTITVMVQEEVARRMCAKPKTREYSALSLFLNFYSDLHYAFKVSRHCFYPEPNVDSAVVKLTLKEPPDVDPEDFFAFVHRAFQQRRKMVKSTLGADMGTLLQSLHENPQARPQELSLEVFLALYKSMKGREK